MELNLNHLRSFCIAAVEGNVFTALNRLIVTQPVLAGHLKSLEKAVGVRVMVTTGKETTLTKSVEDGRNDLALTGFGSSDCRLETRAIGKEELILIASPSNVYAPEREMSVRDLAEKPLVVMKEGSAVRDAVFEYLEKSDVSPQIAFECSRSALLRELVGRDNGIGFIERSAVLSWLEQGFLKEVRVAEGLPGVVTAVAYPHGREISTAALIFLKLMGGAKIDPPGPMRPLHGKKDSRGTWENDCRKGITTEQINGVPTVPSDMRAVVLPRARCEMSLLLPHVDRLVGNEKKRLGFFCTRSTVGGVVSLFFRKKQRKGVRALPVKSAGCRAARGAEKRSPLLRFRLGVCNL